MYVIEKGPFTGTPVPPEQLVPSRDEENNIRLRLDGQPMLYWPAPSRTPIVLERFSPRDGWSITVSSEMSVLTLPDRLKDGNGQTVMQPSVLFIARLAKDGTTYAEASSLALIWGVKAWELGETIARGRLYDALGLAYPMSSEFSVPATPAKTIPSVSAHPRAASAANDVHPATIPTGAAGIQAPVEAVQATVADVASIVPSDNVVQEERPAASTTPIDANLMRTIETQAAAKGVVVPSFASVAEAKAFLKDLLKPVKTPNAAGAS